MAQPETLDAMQAALQHRRGDCRWKLLREGLAIGISGWSDSIGGEPIFDDGEVVVALHGTLWDPDRWNDSGRTGPQAALLRSAYQVRGERLWSDLRGAFALILFDRPRGKLFCVRDPVGLKPLFVAVRSDTVAFASECGAILACPWQSRELDESHVLEWLIEQWPEKRKTFWRGVERVPNSSTLEVTQHHVRSSVHWQPELLTDAPCKSFSEARELYRDLFLQRVQQFARSPLPLACTVSGGLDSSSIFGVLQHLSRMGGLPAPGIVGLTLAAPAEDPAFEQDYAEAVAAQWGASLHAVPLSPGVVTSGSELSLPPNGQMDRDLLATAAAAGTRVLLCGMGGDEWSGGPARLWLGTELAAGNWGGLWNSLRHWGLFPSLRWVCKEAVYRTLPRGAWPWFRRLRAERPPAWLGPRMLACWKRRPRPRSPLSPAGFRSLDQVPQWEIWTDPYRLFALEFSERECSRHGLDYRCPFNDPELIQFAFSTPARWRWHQGVDRYLHRVCMDGFCPETVRWRTSKAEFSSVYRQSLRAQQNRLELLARRRADWVCPEALRASTIPPGPLWTLYACDALAS